MHLKDIRDLQSQWEMERDLDLKVNKKWRALAPGRGNHKKSGLWVEQSGWEMKDHQVFHYFLSLQGTDSMEVISD